MWDRLDPEHQQALLSMKQIVDDVLNFSIGSNDIAVARPSRVASNTSNLEDADWTSARITRELGICNAQIKVVDESEVNYFGYWDYVSAAITKLCDLDDSSYRDSPYYPADLMPR